MFSKKSINYALCMILIFLSGSPATSKNDYELYISGFFLLVGALALKNGFSLPKKSVYIISIFGVLIVGHYLMFGQSIAMASIGFLMQMTIAILLAGMIPQFPRYFVQCMFLLAAMSLFFYFVFVLPGKFQIFAPFDIAREPFKINIGLHTFYKWGKSMNRNSGIFWEPGAFAGYLAIALYMVAIYGNKLKISTLKVVVLIVALGTTLSTMGYIAFLVVCSAYAVRKFSGKNPLLVFVGLPTAFLIMTIAAFQLADSIPFLKEKIVSQFHDVEDQRGKVEINRFGNALYDLDFFLDRPIIGWSANVETRAMEDYMALDLLRAQGNALTGFAVRFGIVGWLTMILGFLTAFFAISRSIPIAVTGVGLIAVMFVGEKYMNFPLIMTFMFLTYKHTLALTDSHRRRRRRPQIRRNSTPHNAHPPRKPVRAGSPNLPNRSA